MATHFARSERTDPLQCRMTPDDDADADAGYNLHGRDETDPRGPRTATPPNRHYNP